MIRLISFYPLSFFDLSFLIHQQTFSESIDSVVVSNIFFCFHPYLFGDFLNHFDVGSYFSFMGWNLNTNFRFLCAFLEDRKTGR